MEVKQTAQVIALSQVTQIAKGMFGFLDGLQCARWFGSFLTSSI
jgi:hypothetical protein